VIYRAIDAPAMRIKTANSNIVDGNEYHEHHHEREMPETAISSIEESKAHYVSYAGTPVTIEDCCTAEPSENTRSACSIFLHSRRRE
jgi:hypothetical protein